MTEAEKINRASVILMRGRSLLNKFFKGQDQFEAFFNAENEGRARDFILKNMTQLPPDVRSKLADFNDLNEIVSDIQADQQSLLFKLGIATDPTYINIVEKGILEEQRFVKGFTHNPDLLAAYTEVIDIIKENCEDILFLEAYQA